MHPSFQIAFGSLIYSQSAYSLFQFLAAVIMLAGGYLMAKRRGLPGRPALYCIFVMLICAFVGARILHIISNLGAYRVNPEMLYSLGHEGFSLYGGIIAGIISGIASCRIFRIDIWVLGDSLAPLLGASIALMRIGCYLNGCCFGAVTALPVGVVFPLLSPAHKHQLAQDPSGFFSVHPVHPVQLYELSAALIAGILSAYLLKKKVPDGIAIISFGLVFTAFRISVQHLRIASHTFNLPGYFYYLLYFVLFALGSALFYYRLKRGAQKNRANRLEI